MKAKLLSIVITCAILLNGCSDLASAIRDKIDESSLAMTSGQDGVSYTQEILVIDEMGNPKEESESTGFTSEENVDAQLPHGSIDPLEIRKMSSAIVEEYAYDNLTTNEERSTYRQIYDILTDFEKEAYVTSLNTDVIDRAFSAVLTDHPEIFYVKGYSIKTYTRNGITEKITLSGSYVMDEKTALECKSIADSYVNNCEATIPYDADDYTKVKLVYEYIIKNTEYDKGAPNNQNVISVFRNHRSVCQGYAKALQLILNDMGVFCTLVEGTVKDGEAHVWDLVRIDGEYYHVDPTWGDASYKLISDEERDQEEESYEPPNINYDYLCTTTADIERTHQIKSNFPIPECRSVAANYYYREGLYFDSIDEDKLDRAFSNAYNQYKDSLTLKCSDEHVYSDMKTYLLTEQKIFKFLRDTSISYVEIPEQYELMFYL